MFRLRRQARGLTLAEVIILVAITALLATTLVAIMTICLRYYRESKDRSTMETNARTALLTISNEFRQGASAPGATNNAIVISPAPLPAGQQPTQANVQDYLIFTKYIPTISQANFFPTQPQNFEEVEYYTTYDPANLARPIAIKRSVSAALSGVPPTAKWTKPSDATVAQTTTTDGQVLMMAVPYQYVDALSLTVITHEGSYTDELDCKQVCAIY